MRLFLYILSFLGLLKSLFSFSTLILWESYQSTSWTGHYSCRLYAWGLNRPGGLAYGRSACIGSLYRCTVCKQLMMYFQIAIFFVQTNNEPNLYLSPQEVYVDFLWAPVSTPFMELAPWFICIHWLHSLDVFVPWTEWTLYLKEFLYPFDEPKLYLVKCTVFPKRLHDVLLRCRPHM